MIVHLCVFVFASQSRIISPTFVTREKEWHQTQQRSSLQWFLEKSHYVYIPSMARTQARRNS